jgi:hypothetical protein
MSIYETRREVPLQPKVFHLWPTRGPPFPLSQQPRVMSEMSNRGACQRSTVIPRRYRIGYDFGGFGCLIDMSIQAFFQ